MKNALRFVLGFVLAMTLTNAAFASVIIIPGKKYRVEFAKTDGVTYTARPTNGFETNLLKAMVTHVSAKSIKYEMPASFEYIYAKHPQGDFILIEASCNIENPDKTINMASEVGFNAVVEATDALKRRCIMRELES